MWSVVEFNDDRSVEAVPSFWIKKKKCAWPKKNSKRMIEKRYQPNEIEFDFLKARVLGNDIGDYTLARAKAKKAEYTSDLSTNDSSSQVESNMISSKKKFQKQKQTSVNRVIMWSPKALDNSCGESAESDDSDKDPNYKPASSAFVVDRTPKSTDNILSKINENITYYSCPDVSSNVKKVLNFDNDRRRSLSPSILGVDILKTNSKQGIVSNKLNEPYLNVVHTSSSPFKVSLVETSDVQQSRINTSADINYSQLTPSNSQLELLQKINRTTCTIKYDLQYLSDKVSNLENMLQKQDCIGEQFMDKTSDHFQNEILNLPLETEEELDAFEKNLLNNDFRTKMISELKRYSRNSLPSTIRSIMRFIFKDNLLEKYSYKGFKKKKVFHTLSICSVIFEAIKHMKKFSKFDAIDVETPLRTFISGAKFRDPSKKAQLDTHNSSV